MTLSDFFTLEWSRSIDTLVNIFKTLKDVESKNALILQCLLIWVVKYSHYGWFQATDRNSELAKGANLRCTSQEELVLMQQWVFDINCLPKGPENLLPRALFSSTKAAWICISCKSKLRAKATVDKWLGSILRSRFIVCAQQTYSSGIQAWTRSVRKHGAPSDGSCELRGNGKATAAWWSLGVWSLASSPAPCRRSVSLGYLDPCFHTH